MERSKYYCGFEAQDEPTAAVNEQPEAAQVSNSSWYNSTTAKVSGAVAGLSLLTTLGVIWWRRKNKAKKDKKPEEAAKPEEKKTQEKKEEK